MIDQDKIPFNKPFLTGYEDKFIQQACASGRISGDGIFTRKSSELLENIFSCQKVLLTTSCTSALEMCALLLDIKEGDNVIIPSFTFVSTANAFALRGAEIRFCDIREDTLNIDESKISSLIDSRTKAIVPVHYAGNACNMREINSLISDNISIVEDAAQAIHSSYQNKPLGTFGRLGAVSFHDTKNIYCGEGGALLINDSSLIDRAEYIREKGTDRSAFMRGEVDKYTWIDIGSSYLMGELNAAFLYGQLLKSEWITTERLKIWNYYNNSFQSLQDQGFLRLPKITPNSRHNAHLFYILLSSQRERNNFLDYCKTKNLHAIFHYVPLHSSPGGQKFGITNDNLLVTSDIFSRLVRIPLWLGINKERVVSIVNSYFRSSLFVK